MKSLKSIATISGVLLFVIAFIVLPSVAQEKKNHTIVKIMDFIEEADEMYWTNQHGETIGFNDKNLTHNSVYQDVKKGLFRVSEYSSDQSLKNRRAASTNPDIFENTLAIELLNQKGQKPAEVRGIHTMTLPDLKRIQLEVDYEEIIANPNATNQTDFYIEVQERDRNNPNQWVKAGEIRQVKPKKMWESYRIFELADAENKQTKEMYTTHSYNAVLSNWAGREVRIILAAKSKLDADAKLKGRWLNAKLVGATFDYKIVSE